MMAPPRFRRGVSPRLRKLRLLHELRIAMDPAAYLQGVLGITSWDIRGDEWSFSCPLPFGQHRHGDSSASSSLNVEKLAFNCFVCGGGDIVWLTQTVLDLDHADEALALLKETLTRDLSEEPEALVELLKSLWRSHSAPVTMPRYSHSILRPWIRPTLYLDQRGVTRDVQAEMMTGIDMRHRDKLAGGTWVTYPRIVIPHFFGVDEAGLPILVGWQKRAIIEPRPHKVPKYTSSPTFPKDLTLYNYNDVDPTQPVVVVESPTSILRMRSEGVPNVVGTMGAEVTDEQIALLRGFPEVITFFDPDIAGRKATRDVVGGLYRFTRVWAVELPLGSKRDPGDMTRDEIEGWIEQKTPSLFVERPSAR
jgi:hypothetical protein